jgi:hypothetical protein
MALLDTLIPSAVATDSSASVAVGWCGSDSNDVEGDATASCSSHSLSPWSSTVMERKPRR